MKQYTKHLVEEMKVIEGATLTTDQGHIVAFRFQLIPADIKWLSTMSGELNNCAIYLSPFANVNQSDKITIGGSIDGPEATWQAWDYSKRIQVAEVSKFKARLNDSDGKQRSEVTKLIAKEKPRQ